MWKCVILYRMSEYLGFILVNILWDRKFLSDVTWFSENSGVGWYKFHCINKRCVYTCIGKVVIKINIPLPLQTLRSWSFSVLILENWPIRRLHSVDTVFWLDDIRVQVQKPQWKEILICLSSSCVPNVVSFSGLSIFQLFLFICFLA